MDYAEKAFGELHVQMPARHVLLLIIKTKYRNVNLFLLKTFYILLIISCHFAGSVSTTANTNIVDRPYVTITFTFTFGENSMLSSAETMLNVYEKKTRLDLS